MEALDKLEARKALRLDPNQILRPVEVQSVDDIRRIIAELDPARNPIQHDLPINTMMNVVEDGTSSTYRVEANTRSKSKRDMIIDGLNIIKARIESAERIAQEQESVEVNGVQMRPAPLGYRVEGSSWVDPLIKQWFGGYRDGLAICWRLDGFVYRYDPYTHKLHRVQE